MPTHAAEFNPYNTTAARKHMIGEIPRPKTVTVDLHNHMRIPEAAEIQILVLSFLATKPKRFTKNNLMLDLPVGVTQKLESRTWTKCTLM
jgi:hypothetical protein